MVLEWLWRGLVTELLGRNPWVAVAVAGGIGLLALLLKAKDSRWAAPILYGLAGSALVAVIWFAFTGITILSKQQPQTTIENVETNIRRWIDTYELTVQKWTDRGSHFAYIVSLPNSTNVSVKRMKVLDNYIIFETTLIIPPKEQLILEQMSEEQMEWVINELVLEMSRLNIEWQFDRHSLKSIDLFKSVPITSSFTEYVFIDGLHAIGNAALLASARLFLTLTPRP